MRRLTFVVATVALLSACGRAQNPTSPRASQQRRLPRCAREHHRLHHFQRRQPAVLSIGRC